jgi:histone-lysine N-methyltransferase SETMAR
MLIVFFDVDELVHHEQVPRGQTVNNELYKTVLQHLCDAVRRHHPKTCRSGNWILHHDSVTTNEFLVKQHSVPPTPPYSPDLAPCNFFLFLQLKKTMKGRRFDDKESSQCDETNEGC